MAQGGGGSDGLTLQLRQQLAAARAVAPDLEVQQLKASVRARLFGIVDTPPKLGGYTILRLIGRGGMGAVYEARDARGEVVALKALRGCEPAALVRFKHEFRALSDLVHPNLALLYSLAITGDQAFLTMERIDGVDFLTHVGQAPTAGLATRLHGALVQLVDGLGALHAAGKLHRDVKPSNVLVTREGRVVILDFGLVQELAGTPVPGGESLAGTPAYMAPELFLGAAPSTASDWYSVGVMLYEALAGALPFTGTALAVLRDKCEREPPTPPPVGGVTGADATLALLCTQLLARDPAARPDRKAITAALEAAAQGKGLALGTGEGGRGARVRSPVQAPLIGRQDELDVLRKAAAGVRGGEPAVVLVRGGSGLGKTTLVDSFLQELDGQAVILRGRCYEREQVPHNAFDGLVDALVGHLLTLDLTVQAELLTGDVEALVRLFPGLQRLPWPAPDPMEAADPDGAEAATAPDSRWRHRAYTAFKALLGAIAARTAVVLYIDDLHWADADSATLLAALVSAPAPSCLLLTSYRAGASGPAPVVQGLLQQLRGGGARVWELTLEPLTIDEAERLARALLGPGPAGASAMMVARESAGIPLFVHELVHDMLGCMSAGVGAWPARLEDLIGARVAQLPESARDMLELLAVAARPLTRDLVISLPGQTATGRAALQTLGAAGLVRASRSERGELIEVCHDRIRETVLAGLVDVRVRDCHRRLAATIAAYSLLQGEAPIEPEILAHHLFAAGDPASARQHMITAASRATKALAFARAAELSLAAIPLCPVDDGAGRLALRVDAAQALMHAGQLADAAACFLAAAAEAPPVQALRLRQRAAEMLLNCGAPRRGMELLQEVLTALGQPPPRNGLSRATRVALHGLWLRRNGLRFDSRSEAEVPEEMLLRLDTLQTARLAVVNVDPLTARMYQLEHLRQCLEVGEPRRIVRAVAGYAAYVAHAGTAGAVEAGRLLDQARAIAAVHGHHGERYIPVCAGFAAFNVGAWRTALGHFESALPRAGTHRTRNAGAAVVYGMCGQWILDCNFYLGDLQGMRLRRDECLAMLQAEGDRANDGWLSVGMYVFAMLAADDPAGATQELTATLGRWPREGFARERATAFIAARAIDVYSGDGPRAWARCAERWPSFAASYLYQGQYGRVLGEFWRGAAALQAALASVGSVAARLRSVAESSAATITRQSARWADPFAYLLRSAALAQRGDREQARRALAVATAGFDGAGMRLWAVAARWQSARLTGDATQCAAQERSMRVRGVVAPTRMAATLAPGFPR